MSQPNERDESAPTPEPTAASFRAAVELAYTRGEAMLHGVGTYLTCPECRRVAEIIDRESGYGELLASLRELVDSPNAKQNAAWHRARAALARAGEPS